MKLIIKEISPSRKELRVTLTPITIMNTFHYIFGGVGGNFDEGTVSAKYIPSTLSGFLSAGPNPAIIRLIVAYLKDTLGMPSGFADTVLTLKDNSQIPIINVGVDDISLINLTSNTIPSMVIKLSDSLPASSIISDEILIEKQVLNTQEQEVYYIPKPVVKPVLRGLDYDEGMKDEVGNSDNKNIEYENYDELSSSFAHFDKTVIGEIISGSDANLKINYNKFENHTHFGSAVSKLENFKLKVSQIEDHLVQISQSLQMTGSLVVNDLRENLFTKIQDEKNSFTPYEKTLYYNGSNLGFKYNICLGDNYISNVPLNNIRRYEQLQNNSGFSLVHKSSGSAYSISSSGHINLFKGKYKVEDKPFYNWSGSFYLSFLMKADTGSAGNIIWENYQEENIPKLPSPTLYSSSILEPNVTSSRWLRYIYHASSSYWAPHSSNPIIGYPGSINTFEDSSQIQIFSGSGVSGSYEITAGSRYSNLATAVTSSGLPFVGSISPAGELFRIYVNTNYSTAVTSSYLTDIKITKYDPINVLPFSEIHKTGSTVFQNWYDDQHESASAYDRENLHALMHTLPEYLNDNNQMDNTTFRKFVNLTGEYFDLIKNYIDNYVLLQKKNYNRSDSVPDNLLPVLANQYDWQFMLPYGNSNDAKLANFMGSTLSNINNTADIKNNIWRNIIASINYMYKTKGTHNSIRALFNSYGFPPDILKLREHGASMDSFDDSTLSDDVSTLTDGLGGTTGN